MLGRANAALSELVRCESKDGPYGSLLRGQAAEAIVGALVAREQHYPRSLVVVGRGVQNATLQSLAYAAMG